MSFAPFLGGKRICLGKTFVEVVSKAIGPTIVGHFDFLFTEKSLKYNKLPPNNLQVTETPSIIVNIKEY
jgi:cytochrome P450